MNPSMHISGPLVVIIGLLSGCTTPYWQLNAFGPKELLDREAFEPIDLAKLIESATPASTATTDRSPSGTNSLAEATPQERINTAFRDFYGNPSSDSLELRRNRVQERILASSTQRCAAYTRFLKQFESEVGFGLGAIATSLAGAGAIFTPATTVRALSGAAAITSGVNAEYSDKLFARLTIQVITKAIDSRRSDLYKEIKSQQSHTIQEYPVEAAVKDALYYHGACSLLSGLEQAATSIERASNPGLDDLTKFADKFNAARNALNPPISSSEPPKTPGAKTASPAQLNPQ